MPQLGTPELIIILVIVIIIFGVGRLPEIGAALGKAIRGFRDASSRDDSAKSDESSDKKSTGE